MNKREIKGLKLKIQSDYVQIGVKLRPDISISKVVQLFKGLKIGFFD